MTTAQIALRMMAVGLPFAPEQCARCERVFERGEMMTALEEERTGEPLGWWCPPCLDKLGRKDEAEPSAESVDREEGDGD